MIKKIIDLLNESLEIKENEYKASDKLLTCPTWDSFGILALTANFKDKFNIQLNGNELVKLISFQDLYNYLLSKKIK
jgi:acyl carrier protein